MIKTWHRWYVRISTALQTVFHATKPSLGLGLLMALIAGCSAPLVMSGGSVNVVSSTMRTNTTDAAYVIAASGANATRTGDNADVSTKGSASFTWNKSVIAWILIGAAAVVLIYLIYKFVFTGAKLSLLP